MGTWHLQDLTTEAAAPPTPAVKPAAYVFKAQGTQHVVYTDGHDGHVHELWWDNTGWHHNDLTAATGAPDFAAPPAAYVFDLQVTQHVVYAGFIHGESPTLPLQELWWDNTGWHRNDLSATSGAPYAKSRPAGYVFDAQGTQHVVYFGANDAHVHEMWWNLDGWHHNDLTAATGSPQPAGDRGPVGYVFDAHKTQHVFYVGDLDAHVHELWWDHAGWHHYDVTAATGAPKAYFEGLSAYTFDAQGTQHVVYTGVDLHVHELWWDVNGWHHSDLSAATGAPDSTQSAPSGYVFDVQRTQHVVYVGADGHVHELWWHTSGWHHNDLSAVVGAPAADGAFDRGPVGYAFEAQRTQHVIYVGADAHIYELWWG
jgi:Fungal fucose-specific lectin